MTQAVTPGSSTLVTLTPAKRQAALRQSKALSRELKKAARSVQSMHGPRRDTFPIVKVRLPELTEVWNGPRRLAVRSFVFIALVPSLLCVLYFALWASDQYVVEARFAVRAGERSTMDTISAVTGLASLQQAQDSLIVTDFIVSRAIVEKLDKQISLRSLYAKSSIDYFSRFDAGDPIEDLVRYWRAKVGTWIEIPSGIITLTVRGFTPQDALKIANAVVSLSEELINDIRVRAESDLVAQAQKELQRAEERMRDARVALRELRDKEGIIDPKIQAEAINTLIDQVRLERIKMAQELSSILRTLSETAPQVTTLRSRIRAADEQITSLQAKLTTAGAAPGTTVSQALVEFDKLTLEQQIAEKQYIAAASALEQARVTAERKRVYLSTFVHPVLPEDAIEPKRTLYSIASVLLFFFCWLAFMLIVTQIRLLRAR